MGGNAVLLRGEKTAAYKDNCDGHSLEITEYAGVYKDSLCHILGMMWKGKPFHLYTTSFAVRDLILPDEAGIEAYSSCDGQELFRIAFKTTGAFAEPPSYNGLQRFYDDQGAFEEERKAALHVVFSDRSTARAFLEQLLQNRGLSLTNPQTVEIGGIRMVIPGEKNSAFVPAFGNPDEGWQQVDYVDVTQDSVIHTAVKRKKGDLYMLSRTALALKDIDHSKGYSIFETGDEQDGGTPCDAFLHAKSLPGRRYEFTAQYLTWYISGEVTRDTASVLPLHFKSRAEADAFLKRLQPSPEK
jgi:hypothetical protein